MVPDINSQLRARNIQRDRELANRLDVQKQRLADDDGEVEEFDDPVGDIRNMALEIRADRENQERTEQETDVAETMSTSQMEDDGDKFIGVIRKVAIGSSPLGWAWLLGEQLFSSKDKPS